MKFYQLTNLTKTYVRGIPHMIMTSLELIYFRNPLFLFHLSVNALLHFFQLNYKTEDFLHKMDLLTIMPAMFWANQELVEDKLRQYILFTSMLAMYIPYISKLFMKKFDHNIQMQSTGLFFLVFSIIDVYSKIKNKDEYLKILPFLISFIGSYLLHKVGNRYNIPFLGEVSIYDWEKKPYLRIATAYDFAHISCLIMYLILFWLR